MSNDVYGYFEIDSSDSEELFHLLEVKTGLGIQPIRIDELYNFPEDYLPKDRNRAFCFCLGDSPGKKNATYLIDFLDYDPDANIGLPVDGKKRLSLLPEAVTTMIETCGLKRLLLAVTDSSQIEVSKSVRLARFSSVLLEDFESEAPPDCLYEIFVD